MQQELIQHCKSIKYFLKKKAGRKESLFCLSSSSVVFLEDPLEVDPYKEPVQRKSIICKIQVLYHKVGQRRGGFRAEKEQRTGKSSMSRNELFYLTLVCYCCGSSFLVAVTETVLLCSIFLLILPM